MLKKTCATCGHVFDPSEFRWEFLPEFNEKKEWTHKGQLLVYVDCFSCSCRHNIAVISGVQPKIGQDWRDACEEAFNQLFSYTEKAPL